MRGFGKKILFDKRYRLLAHLLFWCLYFFVFCMASTNGLNDLRIGAETAFLFSLPNLIYVYVVLYGLVPFLIKGRYWYFFLLYCVWSVAGMVINFLFRYYVLLPIRDHHWCGTAAPGKTSG